MNLILIIYNVEKDILKMKIINVKNVKFLDVQNVHPNFNVQHVKKIARFIYKAINVFVNELFNINK